MKVHMNWTVAFLNMCTSGLSYGEIEALETMVNLVAEKTNKRVLELLFKKYQFEEHCLAIKRYLLLGQGDFIQYLMDMLG